MELGTLVSFALKISKERCNERWLGREGKELRDKNERFTCV